MGSAPACLLFTALKIKGMLLLVWFNPISALFASLSPVPMVIFPQEQRILLLDPLG